MTTEHEVIEILSSVSSINTIEEMMEDLQQVAPSLNTIVEPIVQNL